MNHPERLALANLTAHRVACPKCSDPEYVLKSGWCITAHRLWRYYMAIKMTPKAGQR